MDEETKRREQASSAVAEWNALHPVGTKVRYWPSLMQPPVEAVTRGKAWVCSGTAVVPLDRADGKTSAACALGHVRASMSGPSLFDAAAGEAALDAALEQVEEHAAPDWKEAALDIVHELARCMPSLTSEDVWDMLHARGVKGTQEPRAMGPIMRRAAKAGWITATDRTRKSELPQQNRRPLSVWRSRICTAAGSGAAS